MQVNQRWTNVSVTTVDGVVNRDLLIVGDKFGDLIDPDTADSDDWQLIDGNGSILYPGMIDLLQHGMQRHLYSDATPGAVEETSQFLLRCGTTGFLPSIGATPADRMEGVLRDLSAQCRSATGASAIGVHSEGPCFALAGAHNPENLGRPGTALADAMLEATDGALKAVTLAPELPGSQEFIGALKAERVSIHLGHSFAAPEDVSRYVSWGIDAVTHMYNVMPTLPSDSSGIHPFSLPDALLAEKDLALGLICDGIHVHPKLVQVLAQLPAHRVFLETDAMKYAGDEDTEFEFYPGYWVRSERGNAVRDRQGGLCGSSLTPDEAMRNYIRLGETDLVGAAHATSLVPARVLGMDDELGSIAPGKQADFVVLEPKSLTVQATYMGGTKRYELGS
ncbi:MAG: amidohydrolase family protein [Pseudomonadota bacterium]